MALIAAGLDRERFEPIVVLPDEGPLGDDLTEAGVEVIIRPLSVVRRGLANPRGVTTMGRAAWRDGRDLGAMIRERGIAIVHSNTSVVLAGAAAARSARVPHVWHVREIYARFGRVWPVHRHLLETASALPCVSQATAEQFRGDGRSSSLVRVIPDGLALDRSRAPKLKARAALGLPTDAPVIAVLGRITDWKGQDVLVRALASPLLKTSGTIGLLAGDAWPGAEDRLSQLLQLARVVGVDGRLRLVGFRSDVENVYGAADIVVVPSTEPDPLPNSALEAAAAGCAVVAADHGGLPEIVRDGETGRLVRPGDAVELARVLASLIEDPQERERLGVAAAADVRERFTPLRLLTSLQSLYDELLANR